MSFNRDTTAQAQKIVVSRKQHDINHARLYFNNRQIQQQSVQKHLGLFLDEKLLFFGTY